VGVLFLHFDHAIQIAWQILQHVAHSEGLKGMLEIISSLPLSVHFEQHVSQGVSHRRGVSLHLDEPHGLSPCSVVVREGYSVVVSIMLHQLVQVMEPAVLRTADRTHTPDPGACDTYWPSHRQR